MIHPAWKRLQLYSGQRSTSSKLLPSVASSVLAACLLMLCCHPSPQVQEVLLMSVGSESEPDKVPEELCIPELQRGLWIPLYVTEACWVL